MTQAKDVHSTQCPVAPLAREAPSLCAAITRAQEQWFSSRGEAKALFDQRSEVLCSRQRAVEDWASQLKAESPVGALFHVHLIHDYVISMHSFIPEDAPDYRKTVDHLEAIQRMCFSVRSFLETATGTRAEEAGADVYMNRKYDPHALAAAGFAAVTPGAGEP
ncbi:MAG: hypothetical protein AB1592_15890 [Pseudomonadota bacterium]